MSRAIDWRKVHVVGVHEDGVEGLSPYAARVIAEAEILYGASRLLALFPTAAEKVPLGSNLEGVLEAISAQAGRRRIALLASGDPNFHGIAARVFQLLGRGQAEVVPTISSLQLAFARIGESWDDAALISVHAQPIGAVLDAARQHDKLGILTDRENSPPAIAALLLAQGLAGFRAYVCERLGGASEKVVATSLHSLQSMSVADPNVLILIRERAHDTAPAEPVCGEPRDPCADFVSWENEGGRTNLTPGPFPAREGGRTDVGSDPFATREGGRTDVGSDPFAAREGGRTDVDSDPFATREGGRTDVDPDPFATREGGRTDVGSDPFATREGGRTDVDSDPFAAREGGRTDVDSWPTLPEERRGGTERRLSPPRAPGIPDEDLAQRVVRQGMLTKMEVRAISLARLRLRPTDTVWDVGAGSGAVSVEAAILAARGRVFAVERSARDREIIQENLSRFGIENARIVAGEAPAVLAGLPDPDAIFIGGSGGQMHAILQTGVARLRPGGRLVANVVALESLNMALDTLRGLAMPTSVSLVSVSRLAPIAGLSRFESLQPVFVISTWKRSVDQ